MPAAPPRAPRPGWYADPRVPDEDPQHPESHAGEAGQFRWWDGTAWTAWLSDSAYAPKPRGAVTRVTPVPVLATPRSPRWFVAGLAGAIAVTLLAAISLIGQGLPQPSQPFLEARPADAVGPERIYRDYALDPDHRAVIYERLAMEVPDGLRVLADVDRATTVLRKASHAYVLLDPRGDLVANLLVGDAEPELVVVGDAGASAERILTALVPRYHQGGGVTPENISVEPWPSIPGAVEVRGYLRYAPPTAGANGDNFRMVVTPWSQGAHSGMGAWIALVPETASHEIHDLLLVRAPDIALLE